MALGDGKQMPVAKRQSANVAMRFFMWAASLTVVATCCAIASIAFADYSLSPKPSVKCVDQKIIVRVPPNASTQVIIIETEHAIACVQPAKESA